MLPLVIVVACGLVSSCDPTTNALPEETEIVDYGVLDRTFDLSSMSGWTGGFDEERWDLHFEDGSPYGNPLHKMSEWTTPDRMIALQINGWPTVHWVTWVVFEPLAKQAAENLGVDSFSITSIGEYHCFEQRREIYDGLVVLDVSVFDEKYHDVHMLSVFCDVRDLERARTLVEEVITTAKWRWIYRRLPLLGELGDNELPPPESDTTADSPE